MKRIDDDSIDLVIIDPPYQMEGLKNDHKAYIKELTNYGLDKGVRMETIHELSRVMKAINIYIWCNKVQILDYMNYYVGELSCRFEILKWIKVNVPPHFHNKYLNDTEYCLHFHECDTLKVHSYADGGTYHISSMNKADKLQYQHPTIKPLEFTKQMIRNSSRPGDIVLDCYLGSGTTAVAAKETMRHYIGIEWQKQFYEIANDRIRGISVSGQTSVFTAFDE